MNPNQPNSSESSGAGGDESGTSLPVLHSWRGVYLFVTAAFVIWVVLLTALQRMFS